MTPSPPSGKRASGWKPTSPSENGPERDVRLLRKALTGRDHELDLEGPEHGLFDRVGDIEGNDDRQDADIARHGEEISGIKTRVAKVEEKLAPGTPADQEIQGRILGRKAINRIRAIVVAVVTFIVILGEELYRVGVFP